MNSRTLGINFASAFTGMKEKSDKMKLAICDLHVRENSAIQRRLRAEKHLNKAITKQNRLWQKISNVELRSERVQRAVRQRADKLEHVERLVEEKKQYLERFQRQQKAIHDLETELQALRRKNKQLEQKTKKVFELLEGKSSKLEEAEARVKQADEKYQSLKLQKEKANKEVKILKRRSGDSNSPSGIENRWRGKIKFAEQRAVTQEEKESALEEEIMLKEDQIEDVKSRRKRIEARLRDSR